MAAHYMLIHTSMQVGKEGLGDKTRINYRQAGTGYPGVKLNRQENINRMKIKNI